MENLKKLRIEHGISQQKLAEQFNISQQAIYKYENGLVEPNITMLINFANYFHTSVDYLVGNSSERYFCEVNNLSIKEVRHLDMYHRLSCTMQEKLDSVITQIVEEKR